MLRGLDERGKGGGEGGQWDKVAKWQSGKVVAKVGRRVRTWPACHVATLATLPPSQRPRRSESPVYTTNTPFFTESSIRSLSKSATLDTPKL